MSIPPLAFDPESRPSGWRIAASLPLLLYRLVRWQALPSPDGSYLLTGEGRTKASVAKLSAHDAGAIDGFSRELEDIADVLRQFVLRPSLLLDQPVRSRPWHVLPSRLRLLRAELWLRAELRLRKQQLLQFLQQLRLPSLLLERPVRSRPWHVQLP